MFLYKQKVNRKKCVMSEIMGYRLGMGITKWQMKKKLCEWVREISLEEVRFRLGS